MKTRAEKAAELFNSGFNCAQSVLTVFSEKYGVSNETALKMSCGLGGGCRFGEICGAVSGAVLVIGLKYGQSNAEDKVSKSICYEKTVEFINEFKAANDFIVCRDILGCDISVKEEYERAQNRRLFDTLCVAMVKSAVEILVNLGY